MRKCLVQGYVEQDILGRIGRSPADISHGIHRLPCYYFAMRQTIYFLSSILVLSASVAFARDGDHDGLTDAFESKYKLDRHRNDSRADNDHDSLNNISEQRRGTNPRKADTDGDGDNDGVEIRHHHDPLDRSDHDVNDDHGGNGNESGDDNGGGGNDDGPGHS